MADASDHFARFQAPERKTQEIGGAHGTDRNRGKILDSGAHGQEHTLQPLACQQDRYADEKRGNRREVSFHFN